MEKLKLISNEIETIKYKGRDIILQGDFNARTSTEKDFLDLDKLDQNVDVVQFELQPRGSADKEINSRGKNY